MSARHVRALFKMVAVTVAVTVTDCIFVIILFIDMLMCLVEIVG